MANPLSHRDFFSGRYSNPSKEKAVSSSLVRRPILGSKPECLKHFTDKFGKAFFAVGFYGFIAFF